MSKSTGSGTAGAKQRPDEAARQDTQAVKDAVNEEREACAKLLELKSADLLLLGGEMTAQELRTLRAFMTNRAAAIRARVHSV